MPASPRAHKNGRTPQATGSGGYVPAPVGAGQNQYVDNLSFKRGDIKGGGQVTLTHETEAPPHRPMGWGSGPDRHMGGERGSGYDGAGYQGGAGAYGGGGGGGVGFGGGAYGAGEGAYGGPVIREGYSNGHGGGGAGFGGRAGGRDGMGGGNGYGRSPSRGDGGYYSQAGSRGGSLDPSPPKHSSPFANAARNNYFS